MPQHIAGAHKNPRLFHAGWLEPLSKTPWWVVPLIWVPVCLWIITAAYLSTPDWSAAAAAFAVFIHGPLWWTLIEYTLHRFVFHLDEFVPDHPMALRLHFLLHGIHHKFPMDGGRLVMPPALFAILNTFVYMAVRPIGLLLLGGNVPLMNTTYGAGVSPGGRIERAWKPISQTRDAPHLLDAPVQMLAYVGYDMFHYAQHHMTFKKGSYFAIMKVRAAAHADAVAAHSLAQSPSFPHPGPRMHSRALQSYHMKHHYAGQEHRGFGITSKLWDHVFGTAIDMRAIAIAARHTRVEDLSVTTATTTTSSSCNTNGSKGSALPGVLGAGM